MDVWMDGLVAIFRAFQHYFSHIRTMEGWAWKALCNEAPFRFEKKLSSSRIRTHDLVIRNFCLDILKSGPVQRVGWKKRRGAVEDVDSSIYETGPGTNILKIHLISMRTLCVRYSRKTRSPSQFFGGKKLKKKKKKKKKKKHARF